MCQPSSHGTETSRIQVQSQQVPRVGELIGFEPNRSYQVVDVLWHLNKAGQDRVTVTACERDWHEHINDVMAEWRKAERNR
jgi:hypothetical protein